MKRWLKLGTFATLSVLLLAFGTYSTYERSGAHAQREQYAVYSAFLEQNRLADLHDYFDRGLLVILDHTEGASVPLEDSKLSQATKEMHDRLNAKANDSEQLVAKFKLPTRYKFISTTQLDKNFQPLELSERERQMSFGGYVTFSRISFNRTATLALFYTELRACPLCGSGEFVLMKKYLTGWKVLDVEGTWSS